jgi:hypothetical protein
VSAAEEALTFGTVVTFDTGAILHRRGHYVRTNGREVWHKVWEPYRETIRRWAAQSRTMVQEPTRTVEGIVIGRRHLTNGINRYNGYDEPIEYVPEGRFVAYLVAYDMRLNPVHVMADDLTVGALPAPAAPPVVADDPEGRLL